MYNAGAIGADSREEVWGLEAMNNILQFPTIPSEEDSTRPWTVSDAYNVSLNNLRAIWDCGEGLVISTVSVGKIGN